MREEANLEGMEARVTSLRRHPPLPLHFKPSFPDLIHHHMAWLSVMSSPARHVHCMLTPHFSI